MRDEPNIWNVDLILRIGVEGIETVFRSLTHAGQ